MSDLSVTDDLFFTRTGMDKHSVEKTVSDTLSGCDDGELYFEYSQAESLSFDDGRIRSASFDTEQGFGLRALVGETTGFAHSTTKTKKSSGLSTRSTTTLGVRSRSGLSTTVGRMYGRCGTIERTAPGSSPQLS